MPNIERGMMPDMQVVRGSEIVHSRGNVIVFKGQGFVKPGIGHELWKRFDVVKKIYKEADEILEDPISTRSFEDPYGDLATTTHAQRATIVYNRAHHAVGKETGHPDFQNSLAYALGNSLGEYSALEAAGAAQFSTVLRLIKLRSEFMQDAQRKHPGSLAAPLLSKKPEERAQQIPLVAEVVTASGIVACLYNSARQTVYGGTYEQLQRAEVLLKERGIRLTQLKTDGAFHHPDFMKEAALRLAPEIDKAEINDAKVPVYANATGEPVQTASEIKQALKNQMTTPVQWVKSVDALAREGFNVKIELGEKSSFLDMALEHPIYVGATLVPIIAGGITLGWKLAHPHAHKR